MPELRYMPFFVMEWMSDTQDLSPDAYRAYHLLLCNMWLNRMTSLPDDHKILRNRARVSAQKWPHVWPEIEHFFTVEDGQVYSKTLSKVYSKAAATHASRSKAGRKGAKAKWRKNKATGASPANGKTDGPAYGIKNKTDVKTSDAREAREEDLSFHDLGGGVTVSQKTVDWIKSGEVDLLRDISPLRARMMVAKGLVTEDECKQARVL